MGYFSIDTRSMFGITSYAEALKHFTTTPESKATSRGRPLFDSDERPLRDNRSPHLRLVAGADMTYFDCVLYQTEMVRFYKPEGDKHRVLLHLHESTSSKKFLDRCGFGFYMSFTTSDGGIACVPLKDNTYRPGAGKTWAADLLFQHYPAQPGRRDLIVSESWHYPVGIRVTSPELRARRKEVVAPFEPYIQLMLQGLGSHTWQGGNGGLYHETLDDAARGDADALEHVLNAFQNACIGVKDPRAARQAMRNVILQGYRLHGPDSTQPVPMFSPDMPYYKRLRAL